MRTILRFVLISWWLIPLSWLVIWPVIYLFAGVKAATEIARDVQNLAITGEE